MLKYLLVNTATLKTSLVYLDEAARDRHGVGAGVPFFPSLLLRIVTLPCSSVSMVYPSMPSS